MTFSNYLTTDIEWPADSSELPSSAVVAVPSSLWSLGAKDFEPEGAFDHLDEMEEDEADDFWDEYEPSEAAQDALDAEWDREMKRLLRAQFGFDPKRIGSWRPEA
jgi:hypothetical protein